MLILYLANLLSPLVSFVIILVAFLDFSVWKIMSSAKKNNFYFLLFNFVEFLFALP